MVRKTYQTRNHHQHQHHHLLLVAEAVSSKRFRLAGSAQALYINSVIIKIYYLYLVAWRYMNGSWNPRLLVLSHRY